MAIAFTHTCGAKFNVSDSKAGLRVKCPKCAEELTIPTADDQIGKWLQDAPTQNTHLVSKPISADSSLDRQQKIHTGIRTEETRTILSCPHCGGGQIIKASLIFESGTSVGNISGVGIGGDGSLDIFGGESRTMSFLAARVAPPILPSLSSSWLAGIIAFILACVGAQVAFGMRPQDRVIGLGLWLFFFAAIAGIYCITGFIKFPKQISEYRRTQDIWSLKWVCMRCGNSWVHPF